MKLYKQVVEVEFGKTIRGYEHPDLIIVDDFFDGKPIDELKKEKMHKFMNEQVIPILKKGGKVFFGSIDENGILENIIQTYPFTKTGVKDEKHTGKKSWSI